MAAISGALRTWILDIVQQLTPEKSNSVDQDSLLYRVDCLYNTVVRYEDVLALDHRVVNLLREVRDSVSFHATSMSAHIAVTLFTGSPGRRGICYRGNNWNFSSSAVLASVKCLFSLGLVLERPNDVYLSLE